MSTDNALVPATPDQPADSSTVAIFMPKHVAAVVPFKDYEKWERLSLRQQARVSRLLEFFAEISLSPEGVVIAAERIGLANGMSGSNLLTLRTKFKKFGWTALAKIYKGQTELPEEFVKWVRGRVLQNKRCTRTVLQEIRDEWANGDSIPGFGTWREWYLMRFPERDLPERFIGVYPKGWSESNLYTKQPTRPQRAAARQGFAAMKRFIPSMVRDTSQLRRLELITVDDFELDFLIRAFNPVRKRWEICRCAGLLAIDVATRRKLAIALVPRFRLSKKERELADTQTAAHADVVEGEAETETEKKTRISISHQDVMSLLHVVFSNHGRPADYGCTVLVENASAAISGDRELMLESLLGVQVARTGLIYEKTLANGFVQSGGRPWEKGWIESLFNLLWNRAAGLPGQKGSSYERKPADHEATVAYASKLLEKIPVEEVARFQFPFLTIDTALAGLEAIFERIEGRTDHRMIGFEERFEYRLPDGSATVDEAGLNALTLEQRTLCDPLPYRESPAERWANLAPRSVLAKVPGVLLALMMLTPKQCTLKDHKITFTLPGKGGFTFADADSEVMHLADGTELLGYLDPARPHVLYVTDLKGSYQGKVRRRGSVHLMDVEATRAEAGEISKLVRACVTGPNREVLSDVDQALAEMDAHNVKLQTSLGIADPVRIQPAPKPGAEVRKAKPTDLARKLAHAPARDAFAAYQQSLVMAKDIAADTGAQLERTAEERATAAEHKTAEDVLKKYAQDENNGSYV